MDRETAILTTLIAYKVVLIGIGFWTRGRVRDGVDYFLGGRKLGPVVAALSASASSSSAWTLLGVSGAAWLWGLSVVWLFPACVGGFVFNWLWLAPRVRPLARATGAVTLTELLAGSDADGRSRRPVIVVASVIILVSFGAYVAAQFQGAGTSFAAAFGLEETASVMIGAAVVLAYTLLGGFWAVSITDTLQGLVMAAACVALPVVALVEVGGLDGLLAAMERVPQPGYVDPLRGAGLWGGIGLVLGLLGIGLGYPGQPHVVNRFMALREGAASLRVAQAVSIGWAVVVYAGMLVVGWAGRAIVPALEDRERVLIELSDRLLPPVASGVLLAAILSAIMSTADSQLLVAASSVTEDLRWRWPRRWGLVARSRFIVLLLGCGAVVAALLGEESIFRRVLFAWTALGAAFGPLLIARLLRGPLSTGTSVLAMVAGFSLTVIAYSFEATRGTVIERVPPFLVAGAVAAAGPLARRRIS